METATSEDRLLELLQEIRDKLNADLVHTPNALITTEEAANFLRVKAQTLALWRTQGRGPEYVKIGSTARYRMKALTDYIEMQTVPR